jgi:hypothetical protein
MHVVMMVVVVMVVATGLRGRNWQSKGDGSESSQHESNLPHNFLPGWFGDAAKRCRIHSSSSSIVL